LSKHTLAFWAAKAAEVEAELLARVPENKIRPRLEPTRLAVELLGDPQRSYRIIHVTGTNGKTSTTRYAERILREMGLRTGRFTSPHLVNFNERIAIDGEPVADEVLYEVWQDIKPILEIVDARLEADGEGRLTFFEALAVLAFAVFADAPVDVLVLEVGMGGAWDSTNVADGDVAVFTPIGFDHMDRLGNTLAEIAETKSGIIKQDAIVVSAIQPVEAARVLLEVSGEKAESLKQFGADFEITAREVSGFGQRFSVRGLAGTYENLFIPILGEHQVENAALAIAAVEAFIGGGQQPILTDVLRAALADASSPGRLQVLSRSPLTVLDASHNPHGAKVLAAALQNSFERAHWVGVVGILAEKDASGVLRQLEPVLEEIVITRSQSPRAIAVDELADLAFEIFGEHRVRTAETLAAAMDLAREMLDDGVGNSIVVTGSVTLVGEALALQQARDANIDDDWNSDDDDDVRDEEAAGQNPPDDADANDEFEDEN
jgi:dihydrofolate synthase/folylpolyglutamate synthase